MSKRNTRKKYSGKVSTIEQLEHRRLLATINVADFGARPNDGVDDTNAIRAAINASSAGDTIVFAGGRFDIRDMIELKSNRTYTGGGTIRRNPGEDFIFTTDGSNANIRIDNLTLDGGGIAAGKTIARNLVIVNCTIQNITKGWPTGNGILLSAGAENTKISNNKFLNIRGETGIYGFNRFHNVEISNNYFDTITEGIHLAYDNGGDNLRIVNNTFIRTNRMAVEIQGRGATNTLIEGNKASEWIENYHGSFFLSIVNLADGVIIRNNHGASGKFGQIDPKANDTPVGMEISGRNVLVEGNVIEGFREGAHLMNIRDAVVRNNKFYNQTWMAIWRTGISTDSFNGENLKIENNEIYAPRSTAFLFHGYSTGTIANNKIYLFGSANEYTEGSNGALNNMHRPGNQVTRMSGSPQPYTGSSPVTGGNNGGGNNGGGTVALPPSAPAGLKATAKAPNQIDVTWSDTAGNEKGFKLYRRDNGGGAWELVAALDANTTMYKDGGVQAGRDYSYRVLAYNDYGASGYSNEHNATTPTNNSGGNNNGGNNGGGTNNPAPVTAPAAPTGVQVVAKNSNRVDVTWVDNSDNETGFKLYRRDNNGGDENAWVLIATLSPNATSYIDGSAEAGMHYSYKLVAYNQAGASAWSNEHDAKTMTAVQEPQKPQKPEAPVAPPAPVNLQARALNHRVVQAKWDGVVQGAAGVKVYRREGDGQWVFIAQMDGPATVYKDGDVQPGKVYSYRVLQFTTHLPSGYSNEDSASLPSTPSQPSQPSQPGAGTGLTAQYFNGGNFDEPVLTRTEDVNFNWSIHAPAEGVGADNFSVRWTGQIQAKYSEEYTFYLTADDGVRLWVDGKLIIDNWSAQPEKVNVGKIALQAGRKYDIKIEYFEDKGHASVVLGWASRSQPYQVVPKTQLFAAPVSLAA